MAERPINARQRQKYDTSTNWATNNPILLAGEIGVESDTNKIKVGDGITNWNDLSYINGSSDGNIILLAGTEDNPINLYADTKVGQIYSLQGYLRITDTVIKNIDSSNKDTILFYRQSSNFGILIGGYIQGTLPNIRISGVRGIAGSSFSIQTNGNLGASFNTFNTPIINNSQSIINSIYAPITSGASGQILKSNGANNAPTWIDMPSTAPTLEEQTIESASWTSLSGQTPYTYSATITLTTTLDTNSIVELINNQPALFATYGFAIGSISGQVATIYSIGQPSESVTLTLGVTG